MTEMIRSLMPRAAVGDTCAIFTGVSAAANAPFQRLRVVKYSPVLFFLFPSLPSFSLRASIPRNRIEWRDESGRVGRARLSGEMTVREIGAHNTHSARKYMGIEL